MELSELTIQNNAINIGQLMKSVLDPFEVLTSRKNIKLLRFIGADVPSFFVSDEMRLRQILNNLVSNALKFTTKGIISVSIDKESTPDGKASIKFFL